MENNIDLQKGQIITNKELIQIFRCANMGGMRRSHAKNALVLVTYRKKELYHDKWIDDIFHYTGMGKIGDQKLSGNQNKTLYDSNNSGVQVHLFEYEKKQYTYVGLVELAEKPYQENQFDESGKMRKVWMFPLKLMATKSEKNREEISGKTIELINENNSKEKNEENKSSTINTTITKVSWWEKLKEFFWFSNNPRKDTFSMNNHAGFQLTKTQANKGTFQTNKSLNQHAIKGDKVTVKCLENNVEKQYILQTIVFAGKEKFPPIPELCVGKKVKDQFVYQNKTYEILIIERKE